MTDSAQGNAPGRVIGTIKNQENPDQSIDLVFLPEENGFATSGIRPHFDLPEILIPAHLVAQDLNLIGAIVSAILERISKACEQDNTFEYPSRFQVMERDYTLEPKGEFVVLGTKGADPEWVDGQKD
ncbi:MAG: hypothetical protein PVG49_00165 [Desulfobacteraceae bacterium]|jgi:hypothetical protein